MLIYHVLWKFKVNVASNSNLQIELVFLKSTTIYFIFNNSGILCKSLTDPFHLRQPESLGNNQYLAFFLVIIILSIQTPFKKDKSHSLVS